MKFRYLALSLTLSTLLLSSCDKQSVHSNMGILDNEAFVCTNINWSGFDKEDVPGTTAYFYPGGSNPIYKSSNFINRIDAVLGLGLYDVIAINCSPGEFGYIRFGGMNDVETAMAYGVQNDSYTWVNHNFATIEEPDWLAVGRVFDTEVSQDMVDKSHETPRFCPDCCCYHYNPEYPFALCEIDMENVIYTLNVNIYIKNIYELRATRAYITGLANGCILKDAEPTAIPVQQALVDWHVTKDSENPDNGIVSCSVRCFGLFNKGEVPRIDADSQFLCEMMLKDAKTMVRASFNCGASFDIDELNKVINLDVVLKQPLPNTVHVDSGFSADVVDWGDDTELNI